MHEFVDKMWDAFIESFIPLSKIIVIAIVIALCLHAWFEFLSTILSKVVP